MRRTRVTVLAAVALAAASGCAPVPGSLEGSISASFDLRYDHLELVADEGPSLVIRYLDDVSYDVVAYDGTNTVAELRIGGPLDGAVAGEPIDVTDLVELDRFVMVLTPDNEVVQDGRTYPDVYVAEVTFDELGTAAGEACAGRLRVIFQDGTTLRGTFDGDLVPPSF